MNPDNCPRCNRGRINAFSHIAGGKCFLCGGSGQNRWGVGTDGAALPMTRTAACKAVRTSIGPGHVMRYGAGFRFSHMEGDVFFDVIGGVVCNVIISDGMADAGCTVKMAQKAMQDAYKPTRAAA